MNEQSQARGERILEATRELLAERGYQAMTMRELALKCGVSVPTLYNRFGGKDELIGQAVQTQFADVLGAARGPKDLAPGYVRLLGLVDRVADGVVELADYNRALFQAFNQVRESRTIHRDVAHELTSSIRDQLGEMRDRGELASWVELDVLAAQIAIACVAATMTWSAGAIGDAGLRPFMENSIGLILVASTTSPSREELLERVQIAQAAVAPELKRNPNAAAPDVKPSKEIGR